jgi:phosphomannomutase/phosphoglucomutase
MILPNRNEVTVDLAAQDSTNLSHYNVPTIIPNEVFRAYDIRGPVEATGLTADLSYAIGLAFASEAREKQQTVVAVGRDGRLSGPELTQALMRGICDAGIDILDIGMVPTPLLYFATNRLATTSGVMVTASHNPGNHNGFKIVLCGKTLTTDEIRALRERIVQQRFTQGHGKITSVDIIEDYEKYVTDRIHLSRPLKVVVDCGNGIAGNIVPNLYRKLGCEVIELFCDVDGRFPNHHPDPTVPENLTTLIDTVKKTQADIGLGFDGDADRLGMVTDLGEIIWPDRQMMLFAKDVLSHQPGADIIFDVKCSRHLPAIIAQYGGNPIMWRTGHSILKAKLFELDAALAGEMSGHIFFKDEWFGFDDGIYVGARLLRILSQQTRKVSQVFAELPNSVNTPELKLPMAEDRKQAFMQQLISQGDFSGAKLITIDGVRVEFPDGWGLIRPSNTSPYLILRFEADTKAGLEKIKHLFSQQLLKIDPRLQLPF